MEDILDKLANALKAHVIKTCAEVAEIYHIPRPENEYQLGYNQAVADIAAKIRRL